MAEWRVVAWGVELGEWSGKCSGMSSGVWRLKSGAFAVESEFDSGVALGIGSTVERGVWSVERRE